MSFWRVFVGDPAGAILALLILAAYSWEDAKAGHPFLGTFLNYLWVVFLTILIGATGVGLVVLSLTLI